MEFQILFQILKDDAMKVLHSICQQSGKLSSGHGTGKGLFSFQSLRKEMPKNDQITTQFHSSHTLLKKEKKVKSLSCVRLFVSPWTAAHQAPPSMGFSRQECWSGVPLPSSTNKASGGDGIPVELVQILKDDVVKVLHSICQQFGKLSSGHKTERGQF